MHPFAKFLGYCALMLLVGFGSTLAITAVTGDFGRGVIGGAGVFLLSGAVFLYQALSPR